MVKGMFMQPPEKLSRAQRIELVDHIADSLDLAECDHSFRWTEAFLASSGLPVVLVLQWLRENDVDCDCDVVAKLEFS